MNARRYSGVIARVSTGPTSNSESGPSDLAVIARLKRRLVTLRRRSGRARLFEQQVVHVAVGLLRVEEVARGRPVDRLARVDESFRHRWLYSL